MKTLLALPSPSEMPELTGEHPLVLVRGSRQLDRDEFLHFCQSIPGAELLHWDFGPVMEMKPDPAARNYLFSREAVPFHWDGAFHQVPSTLAFHCLKAPEGGETLFTDTEAVWNDASDSDRARWSRIRLRFSTEKLAHYGGTIEVDLASRHPRSGRPILRFAEAVTSKLNPVAMEVMGGDEGFLADMIERIYDPRYCYAHRWRDGDYLFADNHRLIHGRNPFSKDTPRHLRRIQIL